MGTYRKRPVEIQAFQMTQERRLDNRDWPEWLHRAWNEGRDRPGALQPVLPYTEGGPLEISTLEGRMRIEWDDWIIQGVQGELYPCKPDIFAATYEEVAP